MKDHAVKISVYKHARRKTRGVIAECDTCGWSGNMRTTAHTRITLAEANDHVRAHRPRKTRKGR